MELPTVQKNLNSNQLEKEKLTWLIRNSRARKLLEQPLVFCEAKEQARLLKVSPQVP